MAILLDGTNYFSRDLSGTGPISGYPFTMTAWIKPPQEFKNWQSFVVSDGSETARFGLGTGNYGRWAIYWKSGEQRTGASFSENYGTGSPNPWSHAAVIFSANNLRTMYVNGTGNSYANTGNISQTLTDADIIGIGYGPTSGSNRLAKDQLAECALYNVALTTAEIDTLAAGFSPLFVRPESLLGYWPLGGPLTNNISGDDLLGSYALSATGTIAEADHPDIFYPAGPTNIIKPLAPAVVIPGTGMGYAVADGSELDYKISTTRLDFGQQDSALEYKVGSNGIE